MRFADAVAELGRRQPEHLPKPDLGPDARARHLLAEPQLTYPTIHVTGTNGKTTTARLAAAVACAHGLTTGLFTSPHLESVTERFEICGEPMAEEAFGQEFEHLLAYRADGRRTGRSRHVLRGAHGARLPLVRRRPRRARRVRGRDGGDVGRDQPRLRRRRGDLPDRARSPGARFDDRGGAGEKAGIIKQGQGRCGTRADGPGARGHRATVR